MQSSGDGLERHGIEEDDVDLQSSSSSVTDDSLSSGSAEPAAGAIDEARQEIRKQQQLIADLQAQLVSSPRPRKSADLPFYSIQSTSIDHPWEQQGQNADLLRRDDVMTPGRAEGGYGKGSNGRRPDNNRSKQRRRGWRRRNRTGGVLCQHRPSSIRGRLCQGGTCAALSHRCHPLSLSFFFTVVAFVLFCALCAH